MQLPAGRLKTEKLTNPTWKITAIWRNLYLFFGGKAGGANENFVRLNFFAKNKIYFRNVHILVRQGEKDHYEKEQHGV